jgi:hypothetical protein
MAPLPISVSASSIIDGASTDLDARFVDHRWRRYRFR